MRLRLVWVVLKSEYLRRVKRRGYLLSALLVPLIIIVGVAIAGFLGASAETVTKPIAVVDQAGALSSAENLPNPNDVQFVAYPDEEAAIAAVNDGTVDAAFVLAPDYATTRKVTAYSAGDLQRGAQDGFRRYMRWNLAAGLPEDLRARASDEMDLVARSLDGTREFSESTWPNVVIPFVAAMLFFITVIGSASDAVRAVVDEKESRTMEILVTSISPNELMGGKILALFAVGMTQMAAWGVAAAVALIVAKMNIPELSHFQMNWSFLILVLAMFLPAYMITAGLLAAAGAATTELREAQQLATFVTLPSMLPAILSFVILTNPNGLASTIMTLFPLTAPLTVSMRWAFTSIPIWQLVASFVILVASAVGSILLAARVFQAGMLRFGQRLSWQEIRQAVQGGSR